MSAITDVNGLNPANRFATSVYLCRFNKFACFHECYWCCAEC